MHMYRHCLWGGIGHLSIIMKVKKRLLYQDFHWLGFFKNFNIWQPPSPIPHPNNFFEIVANCASLFGNDFQGKKYLITRDFTAYFDRSALQYGGAPCVTGITDSTNTNRRHSLLRVLLEVYLIKSPLLKKTINKLIFIEI